jgi:hypothetical protein
MGRPISIQRRPDRSGMSHFSVEIDICRMASDMLVTRPMKRAGFLLLACLPIACSSAADDASNGSESNVTSAGDPICQVPQTLHQLTKANASYYEVYDTEDAARAAVAPILEAMGLKLSPDAAPDAAKQIVATEFAAYQKLYPQHTAGMSGPPLVFLIDNPSAGAFAMPDPSKDKVSPWAFFIHTGMLSAPEVRDNPGVLESTIAHELGHLILKNIFARDKYVFYTEKGQFGFQEKNDATIAAAYQTYQDTAKRMGRLYVPELGNFVFHLGSNPDPQYATYLKLIGEAFGNAQPPAECATSETAATALQGLVDKHLNKSDLTLPLGEDASNAATLSKQWESDLRKCLGSVSGPLADLIAAARTNLTGQGATPAQLDALMPELDESERAIDAGTPDAPTVDRFFAMATARRKAMATVVQDGSFPTLRFFTEEEEADDASVRIARQTGAKLDMILNPYSPTYRTECLAILSSGKTPEYGGFVDPHHALCWRYQHITELSKRLGDVCK